MSSVKGDYFLIIVVTLLVCAGIVVLYVVSLRKGQKSAQPGSLLIAALGLGQMITVVQQLTVIQQFKIQPLVSAQCRHNFKGYENACQVVHVDSRARLRFRVEVGLSGGVNLSPACWYPSTFSHLILI